MFCWAFLQRIEWRLKLEVKAGVVGRVLEFGKCIGKIRRAMSVQVVRSQSLCLLERIAQLGSGARSAGDRRKAIQRLEEIRRRQTQSYSASVRNRGLSRIGRAFVPQ